MNNPSQLRVSQGLQEASQTTPSAARLSLAARRAMVLSYEQLSASHEPRREEALPADRKPKAQRGVRVERTACVECLVRDPVAHPVAPPRPPGAAKTIYEVLSKPTEL